MLSAAEILFLVAAGVAAGLVGTAGGITSMISYPALLLVGLPAVGASVTNSLAILACLPGSAASSRTELRGRSRWLRRWMPVAAAGGAAGAGLLLVTPGDVFERVVPVLVLVASLALLAEPRLSRRAARASSRSSGAGVTAGILGFSAYNGYFGAGAGIMVLTLLLVLVDRALPMANALKNMLVGAAAVGAAAVFVWSSSADATATLALGAGMLAGSNLGPRAARRIPPALLRRVIAGLGLLLALQLAIDPRL